MTLEQIGGAGLTMLFLADIFLTVLYARAGSGLLARRWNRAVWATFRSFSELLGRRRGAALAIAGPLIVISVLAVWALGLTLGVALIVHPELGVAIRPSSGEASTDFITALLVAGNSLSIVGAGDYAPHTAGTRMLFLFNSLVGASVLSLVVSYLIQVYSALRQRNAFALTIDLMTGGTGDAAEMLARLGPNGDFSNATTELGNLVQPLAAQKEAHHFYPLLFYFRFETPIYSVSRFTFVLLDLTTLIETTLDRERYSALLQSAPVASLRQGALLLLETMDRNLPTLRKAQGGVQGVQEARIDQEVYAAAVERLQRAGIRARPNVASYVAQRGRWEPLLQRVAPTFGYRMDEIESCRRDTRPASIASVGGYGSS